MYDIVFLSYNEVNAEKNWELLKSRFPTAKRVDGVKGIHQAHIKAAKKCFSKMFWVVDADARIHEDFSFDYVVSEYNLDTVHVWRSINPVNGLEYGYGGVKLLPRRLTLNMSTDTVDVTTSISDNFKAMSEISNYTEFDTDEFSTWRSAFRECAKLASNTIRGQVDDETNARLDRWCNSSGEASVYGVYAQRGAQAGREYALSCESGVQLGKINDFDWMYEKFLEENNSSE